MKSQLRSDTSFLTIDPCYLACFQMHIYERDVIKSHTVLIASVWKTSTPELKVKYPTFWGNCITIMSSGIEDYSNCSDGMDMIHVQSPRLTQTSDKIPVVRVRRQSEIQGLCSHTLWGLNHGLCINRKLLRLLTKAVPTKLLFSPAWLPAQSIAFDLRIAVSIASRTDRYMDSCLQSLSFSCSN